MTRGGKGLIHRYQCRPYRKDLRSDCAPLGVGTLCRERHRGRLGGVGIEPETGGTRRTPSGAQKEVIYHPGKAGGMVFKSPLFNTGKATYSTTEAGNYG